MSDTNTDTVMEPAYEPGLVGEPKYVLRKICADDIFPMTRIILGIGFDELKALFNKDSLTSIVEGARDAEDITEAVGYEVILSVVQILLRNLPKIRDDLYGFLGGLSGMAPGEVGKLDLEVFGQMIVDVVRKPEFGNFIKVVSKLLK